VPSLTAPRSSTAPRPDPGAVLLEAIQQRDAVRSRRLVQQWVHRRGLASLQEFQSTTLASVAGREACHWLEALLESPAAATAIAPAPAAPLRVHELIDPDGVRVAEPEPAAMDSLLEVEAAFAALAAEFAASVPAAPVPAPSEPEPEPEPEPGPLEAEVPPPVAAALPLSFSLAAATDRAAADATRSALAGIPAPETPVSETEADPAHSALPVDGIQDADHGSDHPLLLPGRLPRLGRFRRLMRGCYEGAIGSLQAARAMHDPPQPLLECDSEGFRADIETVADLPAATEAPSLSEAPSLLEDPGPFEASTADAAVAMVEPVAPLPAFHSPTIPGLRDAAAEEGASAGQCATDLRRVTASLAFRLPRPGAGAGAQGPAPAPEVLADLRAWLPDDGEDLPRAC
jgi:hypothetical protein